GPCFAEVFGQLGMGCQMEVCEKELALPQQRNFCRLRLFDLEDQIGFAEHGTCIGQNPRPCRFVLFICNPRADAGFGFDIDSVPVLNQSSSACQRQGNSVLVVENLFRYSNLSQGSALPFVTKSCKDK